MRQDAIKWWTDKMLNSGARIELSNKYPQIKTVSLSDSEIEEIYRREHLELTDEQKAKVVNQIGEDAFEINNFLISEKKTAALAAIYDKYILKH